MATKKRTGVKTDDQGKGQPTKKYIYVPFWSTSSGCYEAVKMDGREVFLTYRNGRYVVLDELELDDETGLKPIQYTEPEYTFAGEDIENTDAPKLEDIYNEVYSFYRDYFAHPDPRVQKFLALYVIHGYILTRSVGTTFIWLVGQKRTGKTTAQIIAALLGYRAFQGVAPSEPAIYRTLGWEVEYGPLIICREYERASDIFKEIVREGDIPGATVPRADKADDHFVVNHYRVYGSRINSSNSLHGGEADLDRYTIIRCAHLRPLRPRAELYRDPNVMRKLHETRNSLLLWKLANWADLKIPFEDPLGRITEGRDWEHDGGIITLAGWVTPELGEEIRGFVEELLEEGREQEKHQLRAQIIEAIRKLADEKHKTPEGYRIQFEEIWSALKEEYTPYFEGGVEVPTKLIGGDGEVITTTRAGKILREQLFGLRRVWKDDNKKNVKGYVWTAEKLHLALGAAPLPVTGSTGFNGIEAPSEGQPSDQRKDPASSPPKTLHGSQETGKTGSGASTGSQPVAAQSEPVAEPVAAPRFTALDSPLFGRCSYCGEKGELAWKDGEGNCLCTRCREETINTSSEAGAEGDPPDQPAGGQVQSTPVEAEHVSPTSTAHGKAGEKEGDEATDTSQVHNGSKEGGRQDG